MQPDSPLFPVTVSAALVSIFPQIDASITTRDASWKLA